MSRGPLMSIEPVTLETAQPRARDLMETAKSNLGFVPNMYTYMGVQPSVLAGYMQTYADFRENSGFTPPEQEVVFLTISKVNGCDYCTAAHSMIADKKSGVPEDVLKALRAGEDLPDAKLAALSHFVESMVVSRGNPGKEAVDTFLDAGYSKDHVLGIVVAIACKTFSNYVNHLAGTPVDAAFADYKVD
ncbi:carboxymuconolactone decarboxylase family protein [Lutimaribacter sp. EGI FJ00015]|uniref:Carboxymuconolactone decarboxylase family protein n=1 Tax=Lutimaribacter degradans TaxID=2945989 RepID=A0ACC5ZWU9_9RHOB|nr:carboxymuconolactone decarboxylase family protein [Lutimaribacter sp. EGI FJ00013]MCM2562648.1 carboxymuconolactone decarboxylase family protein [Lutimaribacter sp. EGI FJ00013]MCO0613805.1 carboxymuconolactone decarboxylase family protein [Lutimaribacter sp. EGI FJ00015]MCO0636712.1 carboxymuconolactone decarboxylase family protein [Lutimaribacter sp. EGI FJ00014]